MSEHMPSTCPNLGFFLSQFPLFKIAFFGTETSETNALRQKPVNHSSSTENQLNDLHILPPYISLFTPFPLPSIIANAFIAFTMCQPLGHMLIRLILLTLGVRSILLLLLTSLFKWED